MKTKTLVGVLKDFNIDKTPRSVGVPYQHIITNPKSFITWIKWNNGLRTCYTSHNHYSKLTKEGEPVKVKINNIFVDLDMDEENDIGFDKTVRDANLITTYLSELKIPHSISFSGRAGFHIYIHTKPSEMSLDNGLSLKYKGIYAHLRSELNLMTLDQKCAEPKRLCRVPCTQYIKENEVTERKCYPIPAGKKIPNKKEIYEKSKKEIKDVKYRRDGNLRTIDELMDELNIKPEKMYDDDLYGFVDYNIPEDNNFLKLMGVFFRPCIKNALFTHNPSHFIRVASCIKMSMVQSIDETTKFYDRLSAECGWVDRSNKRTRDYNIRHIYERGYNLPNCNTIKMEGYCIGEDCEYYEGEKLC